MFRQENIHLCREEPLNFLSVFQMIGPRYNFHYSIGEAGQGKSYLVWMWFFSILNSDRERERERERERDLWNLQGPSGSFGVLHDRYVYWQRKLSTVGALGDMSTACLCYARQHPNLFLYPFPAPHVCVDGKKRYRTWEKMYIKYSTYKGIGRLANCHSMLNATCI
jgi:hypothetical protein